MTGKRVELWLPTELARKADVAARIAGVSRADLVGDAVRAYVADIQAQDEFKEQGIVMYLDGVIEYDELEAVLGRADANAVQASEKMLDRSSDIADDLAEL